MERKTAMHQLGRRGRTLLGLGLVVGIMVFGMASPAGAASKYARITIHKATCPHDETSDIFTNCHGNKLAGVPFEVVNPSGHGTVRLTDGDGVASFAPRAGKDKVFESSAVLNTYVGAYVYCKDQPSGTVLFDHVLKHPFNGIGLTTWGGAQIIFDWYNLT
jgi:hypothetical protein